MVRLIIIIYIFNTLFLSFSLILSPYTSCIPYYILRTSSYLFVSLPLFLPDYSKGFGGKFGVQKDRQDSSAVGWEYEGKVQKHESQTGRSLFGVGMRVGRVGSCPFHYSFSSLFPCFLSLLSPYYVLILPTLFSLFLVRTGWGWGVVIQFNVFSEFFL